MINLPASQKRATDVPLLTLPVRREYECTLACTYENSYSAHLILLLCEIVFLIIDLAVSHGMRFGFQMLMLAFYFSEMLFKLARPDSNSLPINLFILMKTCITFETKGVGPFMTQVTFVESPCSSSVNSATLWPSNGLIKSNLIATLEGGVTSVISMRPLPPLEFPSHSYTAPFPLAAPL